MATMARIRHEDARTKRQQKSSKPAQNRYANAIKRKNKLLSYETGLPAPVKPFPLQSRDVSSMTSLDLSPDKWPDPTLEGLVWLRCVPRLESLNLNNLDLSWKTPVANAGPMPTAAGIRVCLHLSHAQANCCREVVTLAGAEQPCSQCSSAVFVSRTSAIQQIMSHPFPCPGQLLLKLQRDLRPV